MKKEWQKIKGFQDYEISNYGEIKSFNDYHKKEPRLLNPSNIDYGYTLVSLTNNHGKRKTCLVHRLVAIAFIKNNNEYKIQVNHKDGNKHNNVVTNLEWCTARENSQHACDTGLNPSNPGEYNGMSKIDNKEAIQVIQKILDGKTNEEIAKEYNIHSRYVSLIRHKKRWRSVWQSDFRGQSAKRSNTPRPKGIPGKSKLSEKNQLLIINRILNGEKLNKLSSEYNVSESVISRVKSRKTWLNSWKIYDQHKRPTTIENTPSGGSE